MVLFQWLDKSPRSRLLILRLQPENVRFSEPDRAANPHNRQFSRSGELFHLANTDPKPFCHVLLAHQLGHLGLLAGHLDFDDEMFGFMPPSVVPEGKELAMPKAGRQEPFPTDVLVDSRQQREPTPQFKELFAWHLFICVASGLRAAVLCRLVSR